MSYATGENLAVNAEYSLQPWRTAVNHIYGALDVLNSHIPGCVGNENIPRFEKYEESLFRVKKPKAFCILTTDALHLHFLPANLALSTGLLCETSEVKKLPVS